METLIVKYGWVFTYMETSRFACNILSEVKIEDFEANKCVHNKFSLNIGKSAEI